MANALVFDRQIIQPENQGDAFENFVQACLAADPENPPLLKRLARGKDGAIDLITEGPGETLVVECKFVGKDSTSKSNRRWKEVETNLKKHLPILSANPGHHPGSAYRRWLDTANPVSRYWFCVSEPLSQQEDINLRTAILSTFDKLAELPQLKHLSRLTEPGAVRVLSWDRFHRDLIKFPALRFRWFGGLPEGVSPFETQRSEMGGFRSFLRETGLTYFSRQQYAHETNGANVITEDTMVTQLTAGSSSSALIVTGPGGVGKTRLSLELGRKLIALGWDTYRLTGRATSASIDNLLRAYETPGQLALVLDYAETSKTLEGVAEAMRRADDQAGHRVRLIANCRTSALYTVRQELIDLDPAVKHLAADEHDEHQFATWVTEKILGLGNISNRIDVAKICRGTPAMAAFALYLHRNNPAHFDTQFGALHDIPDFQAWIDKRIVSLLADVTEKPVGRRILADLAISMPMTQLDRDRLTDEPGLPGILLEKLKTDRWAETEDGLLVAAHDVLADGLAANWILDSDGNASDRLYDGLRRAANTNRLGVALAAIDRLASHAKFGTIGGLSIGKRLLQSSEVAFSSCAALVLRGRLMNDKDKISLLSLSKSFRSSIVADNEALFSVAVITGHLAELPPDVGKTYATPELGECLDAAIAANFGINYVERCAYALFPERYRSKVLERLRREPTEHQTHYLLVSLLRSDEPPDTIAKDVADWLADHQRINRKCSFIYKAWLDAKGDLDLVREPIRQWLENHTRDREAEFVYKAWLDAKGDLELVREPIRQWLENHTRDREAQFVYEAWLDAKGDLDHVRAPIRQWLEDHSRDPEAGFVFKAWLNVEGDLDLVREPIRQWLENNSRDREAQFVYKAWLDAKGDLDLVREPIRQWLENNSRDREAQFVYKAWLDAKGDLDLVREPIRQWLVNHSRDPKARFVYKAWLDAKGDLDHVREPIRQWLENHSGDPDTQFVYKAWLDSGGERAWVETDLIAWLNLNGVADGFDFAQRAWLDAGGEIAPVRHSAAAWLHRNCNQQNAVYITKRFSKLRDLTDQEIIDIAAWSENFPEDIDSIFRLSSVSKYLSMPERTEILLSPLFSAATQVLVKFHISRLFDVNAQLALFFLFSNFIKATGFNSDEVMFLNSHFARFVASAQLYQTTRANAPEQKRLEFRDWVVTMTRMALRAGLLNPHRDREGLLAYVGWLEEKAANHEFAMRQAQEIRELIGRSNPN